MNNSAFYVHKEVIYTIIFVKVLIPAGKGMGLLLLLTSEALHNSSRSHRSSSKKFKTKTYGDRSFSVAAAHLWNALPNHFRQKHILRTVITSHQ